MTAPVPAPVRQRHIEQVLSRAVVESEGIGRRTCPSCGARDATRSDSLTLTRWFPTQSVRVKRKICDVCDAEERRLRRQANKAPLIWVAPLLAMVVVGLLGDLRMLPDWLSSPLTKNMLAVVQLLSTGAGLTIRRSALRRLPALVRLDRDTVTLRVPASWASVLRGEQPHVLAGGAPALEEHREGR